MNIRNFLEKLGSFVTAIVRCFQCSRYNPIKQHQGKVVFCPNVVVAGLTDYLEEPMVSMIGAAQRPFSTKRPSSRRIICIFLGEFALGTQNASLLRQS